MLIVEDKTISKNFDTAMKKVAYRGKIKENISSEFDLTLVDDIDWKNMEGSLSREQFTIRVTKCELCLWRHKKVDFMYRHANDDKCDFCKTIS